MYKVRVSLIATLLFLPISFFAQQPQNADNSVQNTNVNTPVKNDAEIFREQIQALYRQSNFKKIDQLAARDRAGKTRFAGGGWRLRTLYDALATPSGGDKATDEQWEIQIKGLQQWIAKDRKSITPRVALAELYTNYAWKARGMDYADKVSDDGWSLFEERLDLAKATLEAAATLKEKCPQWYNAMQSVALGQSWPRGRTTKLFQDAIAFEPGYYYFYTQFANYLLPKWAGTEGETEQFADTVAAKIGGKEGAVVYFKIAALACRCKGEEFLKHMSWPKIQEGYGAIVEQYGDSELIANQFAYMAVRMEDIEVSKKMFDRIGNNWDQETWHTKKYFDQCKTWIEFMAKLSREIKEASLSAEHNLQTSEGRLYDGKISQEIASKYSNFAQVCERETGKQVKAVDLLLQVNDSGQLMTILPGHASLMDNCIYLKLQRSTFSVPPQPQYWVKVGTHDKP